MHTDTSDGNLYEDYPSKEMFTFLKNKFLAEPGNMAKFSKHFIVFCFAEKPYDYYEPTPGSYSTTAGQVEDINKKNVCLFVPRTDFTLNHEVLHGLGLYHTHNTTFTKDVKYTFTKYETTNIMSYADATHPSTTKTSTWKWQWKIMKSNTN